MLPQSWIHWYIQYNLACPQLPLSITDKPGNFSTVYFYHTTPDNRELPTRILVGYWPCWVSRPRGAAATCADSGSRRWCSACGAARCCWRSPAWCAFPAPWSRGGASSGSPPSPGCNNTTTISSHHTTTTLVALMCNMTWYDRRNMLQSKTEFKIKLPV